MHFRLRNLIFVTAGGLMAFASASGVVQAAPVPEYQAQVGCAEAGNDGSSSLLGSGIPCHSESSWDDDNIVWGTMWDDADNIVWGTMWDDADNIVWGTMWDDADNIVWGTSDVSAF